jgi:hypothetical protein
MIDIIDYKDIDIEKIKFNKPDKVKGGSYMSLAEYKGKPIYIQSPKLISNKGIVKYDTRCNLELEFDKNHWKFYEFITNLDDHNVIQIQKNSGDWFSKEFPLDIVEEFYSTPIKIGRGNKPPSLKIKIPIVKGNLSCSIYNRNNNLITHNDIDNGSKMLCVLKFQGLRYLKQQVICEWVPIQIKVFQKGQDSVYLINDNLLSDIESTEKVIENNNDTYEMINNDDLDNIDLHLETTQDNDVPVLETTQDNNDPVLETNQDNNDPVLEPNDAPVLETNQDNNDPVLEAVEEPNDDPVLEAVEEPNDDPVLEAVEEPNSEPVLEITQDNNDFTETTNLNNTEYIKIINEKNLIIEDLQNKFNKLRDFIN